MNILIKNPFERKQKGAVAALCIVCIIFSWSCQTKKNESFDEPKEVSVTEYSLCLELGPGTCFWNQIKEEKTELVIMNSIEEMENYFTHCESCAPCPSPAIDFSKNTLILVQGWAPSNLFYTNPEDYPNLPLPKLQQISPKNYILDIEMRTSENNSNRQWERAFIVNKLNDDSTVELNVTIQVEEDEWWFPHENSSSIIGKWKLIKEKTDNFCIPGLIIDYSQCNIVYEFKSNGIFTVTSDNDYYGMSRVGDHFYSSIEPEDELYRGPYCINISDHFCFKYNISSEQMIIDFGLYIADYSVFYFDKIQ